MSEHPVQQAFADFVIGAMDQRDGVAFEAHVSACDACAARLEREARLELALADVAKMPAPAPRQPRSPARLFSRALPVAAAAAAAVWLAFAHRVPTAEASGPIPSVVCPEGPRQEACVAGAHRHGLFVAYPRSAGAPRFEPAPGTRGFALVQGAPRFTFEHDTQVHHGGRASARLEAHGGNLDAAGVVAEEFDARSFQNTKVRFTAFVKTEDVRGWSGLFLRVDRASGGALFDNMQSRPIRGTIGWSEYAVVLEVPEDARTIRLGALQDGAGRTYVDDARFEIVDEDVPITTADDRPATLRNGDFEVDDLGKTPWFMSGNASDAYLPTIDRVVHHGGGASARLAAKAPAPGGYGVLMYAMRASYVRGQRLRLRAWVRGESVTARGDFWARVPADDSPPDGPGLGSGDCKLSGTFDFRLCEMVLDVPERADSIEIGLGLGGPGTVWLDDVTLEPVDAATTPLAIWQPWSTTLVNGGFEAETIDPWLIGGGAHADYDAFVDDEVHHGGEASAALAPRPGVKPNGYATLLQHVPASVYRGKRLRAIAWVKGDGITARGDVWMRVQAADSRPDGLGLGGGRCVLHDTFDWQPCVFVLDVAPEAWLIQIGAGIAGPGRIWLDDVAFEEVDRSVPVNDLSPTVAPRPNVAAGPIDLDFERVGGVP